MQMSNNGQKEATKNKQKRNFRNKEGLSVEKYNEKMELYGIGNTVIRVTLSNAEILMKNTLEG